MTLTIVGIISAVLVIAGYLWYKLRAGAKAETELGLSNAQVVADAKRREAQDAVLQAQLATDRSRAEKENEDAQKTQDLAARRRAVLEQLARVRGTH